jgi:3,4-dihydroxy 2-butanone 4-phosphate synthase/GTP cyclohydrolase II
MQEWRLLSDRLPPALKRAVEAFRSGDFVVLLDKADREAEADLLLAAQHATGERINAMIDIARGLLTVVVTRDRLRELRIGIIDREFAMAHAPAFAVPVDYRHGTTTGASAYDRALTIRALADPAAKAEDFARPGHVFPLVASPAGLAERQGHTEGAVALALLAGVRPVIAMCEIMAPDGHMARGRKLREWLNNHPVVATSVPQLVRALGICARKATES